MPRQQTQTLNKRPAVETQAGQWGTGLTSTVKMPTVQPETSGTSKLAEAFGVALKTGTKVATQLVEEGSKEREFDAKIEWTMYARDKFNQIRQEIETDYQGDPEGKSAAYQLEFDAFVDEMRTQENLPRAGYESAMSTFSSLIIAGDEAAASESITQYVDKKKFDITNASNQLFVEGKTGDEVYSYIMGSNLFKPQEGTKAYITAVENYITGQLQANPNMSLAQKEELVTKYLSNVKTDAGASLSTTDLGKTALVNIKKQYKTGKKEIYNKNEETYAKDIVNGVMTQSQLDKAFNKDEISDSGYRTLLGQLDKYKGKIENADILVAKEFIAEAKDAGSLNYEMDFDDYVMVYGPTAKEHFQKDFLEQETKKIQDGLTKAVLEDGVILNPDTLDPTYQEQYKKDINKMAIFLGQQLSDPTVFQTDFDRFSANTLLNDIKGKYPAAYKKAMKEIATRHLSNITPDSFDATKAHLNNVSQLTNGNYIDGVENKADRDKIIMMKYATNYDTFDSMLKNYRENQNKIMKGRLSEDDTEFIGTLPPYYQNEARRRIKILKGTIPGSEETILKDIKEQYKMEEYGNIKVRSATLMALPKEAKDKDGNVNPEYIKQALKNLVKTNKIDPDKTFTLIPASGGKVKLVETGSTVSMYKPFDLAKGIQKLSEREAMRQAKQAEWDSQFPTIGESMYETLVPDILKKVGKDVPKGFKGLSGSINILWGKFKDGYHEWASRQSDPGYR